MNHGLSRLQSWHEGHSFTQQIFTSNRTFSVLLRVTHAPSARLMPCEKRPVVSVFTLGRNTSLCQQKKLLAARSRPYVPLSSYADPSHHDLHRWDAHGQWIEVCSSLVQKSQTGDPDLWPALLKAVVQTVALFLVWCCHPHRLAHLHLVHPEEEGQEVLKGQAHCHISTLASRWSELSSFNLQASGDTRTASLWANRETGTNAFLESLQGAGRCARAAGFHGVHAGRGLWSLVFTGNRFTGRAGSGTRGPGPARSPPYPNLLPQPS